MPPKAKKAAASAPPPGGAPLDGCVIAFSGRFTGYKQSTLETKCANLGGRPAKSVVEGTTHVVTTQADYDNLCTKVWQAKDRGGIFIVSLDWLLESEDSNARQAEAQYLFGASQNGNANGNTPTAPSSTLPTSTQPQPVPVPVPVRNNPSIKRQASATPEPKPDVKKTKLDEVAKNGKAAAIGKEQIAKSWDVQVPVDEGCSLIGYAVHIDDDSVIWDASLNQTNAGANNNKFYRIQVCAQEVLFALGGPQLTLCRFSFLPEMPRPGPDGGVLVNGALARSLEPAPSRMPRSNSKRSSGRRLALCGQIEWRSRCPENMSSSRRATSQTLTRRKMPSHQVVRDCQKQDPRLALWSLQCKTL